MDFFVYTFKKGKYRVTLLVIDPSSANNSTLLQYPSDLLVLVLLFAHSERLSASCMRDYLGIMSVIKSLLRSNKYNCSEVKVIYYGCYINFCSDNCGNFVKFGCIGVLINILSTKLTQGNSHQDTYNARAGWN